MQDKHSWPLGLPLHDSNATESLPIIRKQTKPILAKVGHDQSKLRNHIGSTNVGKPAKEVTQPNISKKFPNPPNAWL